MKLEVGQFVRTKDGIIAKVDYIDDNTIFFDKDLYRTYGDSINFLEKDNLERIAKASYNIVDILEVGDYVNGSKVQEIRKNYIEIEEYSGLNNDEPCILKSEDIKSIVTKEQFSQMEYKVGV